MSYSKKHVSNSCNDNVFTAIANGSGDDASSEIPRDDYRYTHGGRIYCQAVDLTKDLQEEYRKLTSVTDPNVEFVGKLAYNGQYVRYFDNNQTEYDQAPANAAIERGEKIFVISWTSAQGYEIINEFN